MAPGEVHVWQLELGRPTDARAHDVLSSAERRRAAAIAPPQRRAVWVHSRALLRELLGDYLGEDPRALRFQSGARGKPALAGADGRLRFSLSHSGARALLALADGAEVGVDLEVALPGARRLLPLADRVFGAEYAGELAALTPAERRRSFLSAWTLQEAQLKCLGLGLAQGRARARGDLWSLALPVGPGAAGALAAEEPPRALRCWRRAGPPGEPAPSRASGVGRR